ncbi:hypothetical protein EON67_11845 [archaeon]|nr:MAG: hypothetical protein EON67_11845 [archaeon]
MAAAAKSRMRTWMSVRPAQRTWTRSAHFCRPACAPASRASPRACVRARIPVRAPTLLAAAETYAEEEAREETDEERLETRQKYARLPAACACFTRVLSHTRTLHR